MTTEDKREIYAAASRIYLATSKELDWTMKDCAEESLRLWEAVEKVGEGSKKDIDR